ncbi:MAG: right-handed parallel beta-helix repeat-containing protein [Anaerolineae bacterium]|nr:right-handed parallel beta-helix repeat-containing protein [Anaerolineae bacterium]
MKHKNLLKLFLIWVTALAATMALLFPLRGPTPAIANPGTHCVTPTGNCSGYGPCWSAFGYCHTTIQAAVDAADPGDDIRVRQGTYTGVHLQGGARQVIYISKTVTIRGGYDNGFQQSFPLTQPTVVDAQGNGRGIYIDGSSGNITPTIEGLWVTGGNASNALINNGRGGGIYSDDATPIIAGNIISNNVAYTGTGPSLYGGGGIYVAYPSGVTVISGNQVISNVANTSYFGWGGGIFMRNAPAVQVINNVVLSNTAAITGGEGYGGGIALRDSAGIIIDGNRVEHNVASPGLSPWLGAEGGGIHCDNSNNTVLSGNIVRYNTAGVLANGQGGGIKTSACHSLTVVSNTIQGNVGSAGTPAGNGYGGGLDVGGQDITINANRVLSNTASLYTSWGWGGGFHVMRNTNFTMTNNIVAGNVASYQGGGMDFETDSSNPVTGTLLHNTFAANNQGSGEGRSAIHVNDPYVSLVLTNNLIYSHTYGIIVVSGSIASLYHTLFYANDTDTSGASIVNTNPITGQDPLLDGTYHLQADSPAIDAGVNAGVITDIDGESRDSSPDIGADERAGAGIYLPVVLKNQ